MNFIISDLGSADSEIIQSVNLNMLRVREQNAARKGTRCCTWVGAIIATYCCIALEFCVNDLEASYMFRRMSAHAQYEL